MLFFQELGRRLGQRHLLEAKGKTLPGTGVIEGGIFAIWGLLLAFTFSGAANRLDSRRDLVGRETNAIGTAYLRLDLLPDKDREPLKRLFRQYLESRIETYQKVDSEPEWAELKAKSAKLQNEIWAASVKAVDQLTKPMAGMLLVPALNEMFDIVTTRLVATRMHPPFIVYGMLLALSLCCAMIVGFNQAGSKRHSLHTVGFILVTTVIVYVIIDMEFPRSGLIRVDSIDQTLSSLLETLK